MPLLHRTSALTASGLIIALTLVGCVADVGGTQANLEETQISICTSPDGSRWVIQTTGAPQSDAHTCQPATGEEADYYAGVFDIDAEGLPEVEQSTLAAEDELEEAVFSYGRAGSPSVVGSREDSNGPLGCSTIVWTVEHDMGCVTPAGAPGLQRFYSSTHFYRRWDFFECVVYAVSTGSFTFGGCVPVPGGVGSPEEPEDPDDGEPGDPEEPEDEDPGPPEPEE